MTGLVFDNSIVLSRRLTDEDDALANQAMKLTMRLPVARSRPHPPVSGASNTADTSAAKPSSSTETAVSPRPYRPCST